LQQYADSCSFEAGFMFPGCWVAGCWWLGAGGWVLVAGCWWLGAGISLVSQTP